MTIRAKPKPDRVCTKAARNTTVATRTEVEVIEYLACLECVWFTFRLSKLIQQVQNEFVQVASVGQRGYMAAERLGSCAPFSPVIEDEWFVPVFDALAEITSPPFAVRVCDMHDPYSLLITRAQADQSDTKKSLAPWSAFSLIHILTSLVWLSPVAQELASPLRWRRYAR